MKTFRLQVDKEQGLDTEGNTHPKDPISNLEHVLKAANSWSAGVAKKPKKYLATDL